MQGGAAMSKRKKILFILLLILVLLAVGVFLVFRHFSAKMNYQRDSDVTMNPEAYETETEEINPEDLYHIEEVVQPTAEQTKDTYTLLVIGGESPEKEKAGEERADADAIMSLTFVPRKKMAYAISFNTDVYTIIPDSGPGYLGNAYAIGGGPLLAQTITENYGIPIDNYAIISIEEAAKVMDLPELSDLDISHQGVEVIRDLIYSLNILEPSEVVGKLTEMLSYVTHNITPEEMVRLLMKAPGYVAYHSDEYLIPYEDLYQEIQGYPVPYIGETSKRLIETIYGPEGQQS